MINAAMMGTIYTTCRAAMPAAVVACKIGGTDINGLRDVAGLDAAAGIYGTDAGRRASVWLLVSELPAAGLSEGEIFEVTENAGADLIRVRATSVDNYGGAVLRAEYRDEMSEGRA